MHATTADRQVLGRPWDIPYNTVVELPLTEIVAGNNDRTVFDDAGLAELAASIDENGLAQPVTVRWNEERERYELVAGERRFRAHLLLGKATIRALVADLTDREASDIMLAENTGRADLDPIDEANAYQARMTRYAYDEKTVAEKAGVSVQRVHNRVKLLKLRADVQHLVRSGNLQLGYAQIMADAGLDRNRQLIALKRLNACPAPTPQWFRKECSDLLEQAAQDDMFAGDLFSAATFAAVQTKQAFEQQLPPDPRKDKAPLSGRSHRAMVQGQIDYWFKAADQWDHYGKTAPRDRCIAAAKALQDILQFMPTHSGKARKASRNGQTYYVYADV